MRRIPAALACIGLAACTASSEQGGLGSSDGPGATPGVARTHPLDGWGIEVSVESADLGPIVVSVGPARRAPRNDARPWVQHDLVFENEGRRPVRFADTRTPVFLGASGRPPLLAADPGCGDAMSEPGAPVEAGACRLYLDAFRVEPHASVSRTITLFKGLPGMGPLRPGTYVFEKPIRFRAEDEIPEEGTGRGAVVRIVYELERPDGSR